MPVYWQWMNRLSPTTWILYGLAGSQLCDSEATIYVRAAGSRQLTVG